jgi:L-ribulose-5-phosphate 4-epimerase
MRYEEIREACCAANVELPRTGLVDLTFGNVSVFDPDKGVFAIKPSGVSYAELNPRQMVILDLDGKTVEGELRPSSDTPTHQYLYQHFGEAGVRSIVHTHSRSAVAFAQAGREIPCLGTTHADYVYGSVPVTRMMQPEEVEHAYEWNTGKVIAECLQGMNPLEVPAALVNGHGPFTWSDSPSKAVETALALEVIAEMALKTLALSPDHTGIPQHLLEKHFRRKHGPSASYGQP